MPKPRGWSESEVKHRDKLAKALIKQGYTESQSYAIATSQIEKARKKHG